MSLSVEAKARVSCRFLVEGYKNGVDPDNFNYTGDVPHPRGGARPSMDF